MSPSYSPTLLVPPSPTGHGAVKVGGVEIEPVSPRGEVFTNERNASVALIPAGSDTVMSAVYYETRQFKDKLNSG